MFLRYGSYYAYITSRFYFLNGPGLITLLGRKERQEEERYVGLTSNILKNKLVRTNQMFDLNIVAKST